MAVNISDLNQWRERRQGSVTLGVEATTPITVSQEQLESGTYILGVQGVGKSSLLESIILQQIAQNESVVAIDPHGDMVREIIARMPGNKVPDTYLLDLKEARDWPFGMNLFALPRGQENSRPARDAVRNQVIHAFERLWPEVKSGLYFGNVLRPIIATLIEKPELTLAHVSRLFYNNTFRSHYTRGIQNFEAIQFWEEYEHWSPSKRERYCDPLLDRIRKLLSDDIVRTILCQKGAKVDLGRAISEGKIFLLSLPLRDPAYEFAAPIIGTVFMTLLHGAIFSMGNLPHARRPGCTVVIDEFQNFVTEDNEQFFSEGRKYRVKQVLAHQGTHQLDRGDTTMKQTATSAYTIVCFRTNKDDAPDMSSLFTGMKRPTTNIYIDVLDRLETHQSASVKEFYWHTVTQLQNAAKNKNTPIEQDALSQLNDVLYYAQKDRYVNETKLQAFLGSYGKLKNLIRVGKRIDIDPTAPARKEWIINERKRIAEEQTREFQRHVPAWLPEAEERVASLQQRMAEIRKIHSRQRRLPQELADESWLAGIEVGRLTKEIDAEKDRIFRLIRDASARRTQTYQRLWEELKALDTEVIEDRSALQSLERTVRSVCFELIQSPLTADKADIPATEIAEQLKGLPNYTALVKIESHLHRITTQNLQQTHPAVHYREANERRNRIIRQTKDKYCRGRREVENEITATFVVPSEPQNRANSVDRTQQQPHPPDIEDDDIIE